MGGAPSPRVNPGASTATGPPVGMVTGAADTPPRRVAGAAADDRSELEPADSSEEGGRGAELEAIKNKVLTVVYVSWALNMSQVSARARARALAVRHCSHVDAPQPGHGDFAAAADTLSAPPSRARRPKNRSVCSYRARCACGCSTTRATASSTQPRTPSSWSCPGCEI